MPYISSKERDAIEEGKGVELRHPGRLNYVFTRILDEYIGEKISYTAINEVIGVLECCKLELYRRLAADYEDQKKEENGDVYKQRKVEK